MNEKYYQASSDSPGYFDSAFDCNMPLHRELEKRVNNYEFRDQTTGLFNRRSFDIVLEMELEKAKRSENDRIRAVMLIRVTGLGEVNAHYGPGVADLLLEASGIRIRESLRFGDYVFRYEGAIFAVILSSIKQEIDIPLVAERIRTGLARSYPREGMEIRLGVQMGVAFSPSDSEEPGKLLRYAFAALEDASLSGQGLALYDNALYWRAMERLRIKTDLRKAIVEEQFELHFQPIVDATRRIVGAESLIRWNHPGLGQLSPADFIDVAEESRDFRTIGRWVFYQSCERVQEWSSRFPSFYLSMNLASREFEDDEFIEFLLEAAGRRGTMVSGSIKLEITETQGMKSIESTIARMQKLRDRGFEVMLDDFGSGYSSLAWLKRLPVTVIKIDRAFVENVVEDEGDRKFLEGMIGMIKSRGKKVLVEGVDSERKFEILRDLGCDLMQGFWLSRPLPAAKFELLLNRGVPLPAERAPVSISSSVPSAFAV